MTKIHNFLHSNKYFLRFIYTLIIINVFSIFLYSFKDFRIENIKYFEYLEAFSVIVFTIEYLLRFLTSSLEISYSNSHYPKIRFIFSFYGLVDLFAILPFYLPLIFPFDLRVLRILRLFRLLRIFKLGRFSKSIKTITSVLKDTKEELSITIFIAFILLILSSTLMYFFENQAQPDKFENIAQSMWWAVATLTTVGYGDIYPITSIGKFLSAIIALLGIGFVALPTGIISSAFIKKIQEKEPKENKCKCPKCGNEFIH